MDLRSCGDFVSYWGSIASILGTPLALITILLAKSISEHIQDTRFTGRLKSLVSKLRASQKSGNTAHVREDLRIFLDALELHYSWPQRLFNKRVRRLYCAVRREYRAQTPSIRLLEGLLLNFKTIHAENQP